MIPKRSPYAYNGKPGTFVQPAPPPIVPAATSRATIPRPVQFMPRDLAAQTGAARGAPGQLRNTLAPGVEPRVATKRHGIPPTKTGPLVPPRGNYGSPTGGLTPPVNLGPSGVPMSGGGTKGGCCCK